jgi:hypothetical protein
MMNREQMIEDLHRGVCSVVFEKKDGTIRTMNCTLHPDRLPERQQLNEVGSYSSTPSNQVRVYDTDLNEWRSFISDSVQSFTSSQLLKEA